MKIGDWSNKKRSCSGKITRRFPEDSQEAELHRRSQCWQRFHFHCAAKRKKEEEKEERESSAETMKNEKKKRRKKKEKKEEEEERRERKEKGKRRRSWVWTKKMGTSSFKKSEKITIILK